MKRAYDPWSSPRWLDEARMRTLLAEVVLSVPDAESARMVDGVIEVKLRGPRRLLDHVRIPWACWRARARGREALTMLGLSSLVFKVVR